MLIDCSQCRMHDTDACGDCVVGYLLREDSEVVMVDEGQARVLALLADEGMVPALRLVPRSATG